MNWKIKIVAGTILFFGALATPGQLHAADESVLRCPAGVESTCIPGVVGVVVICGQGEEFRGYPSISHYCYDLKYPESREEFREWSPEHENIALNAGFLTCKTCHSGLIAENHFLADHPGMDPLCGHCHVGLDCPGKPLDQPSACYPGLVNGGVHCGFGEDGVYYELPQG
jgi:hypothetical protein